MAKKLTKKSALERQYKQQYNRQVNRIRKGYHDIEIRGGSFSRTLEDIIGARPEKIGKREVNKLRKITKESLYRQARTDTGKSGYSILAQRRTEAGKRGALHRQTNEIRWNLYQSERGITIPRQDRDIYRTDFESWKNLRQEQYEHQRWYHDEIEVPRAIGKLNEYKEKKNIERKRAKWQSEYEKQAQEKFEAGLAENPRLDAVGNFIHLTPQEFEYVGVDGKIWRGKGFGDNAIQDATLYNAQTGEIYEQSDRGITPVEVNGIVYEYNPDTQGFYISRHLTKEERERWYPNQYENSNDVSDSYDSSDDYSDSYDSSNDTPESYDYEEDYYDGYYDDVYVDNDGIAHYSDDIEDYIDSKLENIYDRMDELDTWGDMLREELDSAMEGLSNSDKAQFLDMYGDTLEDLLEQEAHYKNDKDMDERTSEKGFNYYNSKALQTIWDGAVPLSSTAKFY